MENGEIAFNYDSVDDAIHQLEALRASASQLAAAKASLPVSRGAGADGLRNLSSSMCAFAPALESEIAGGIAWLSGAKADFGAADASSAQGISSIGQTGGFS